MPEAIVPYMSQWPILSISSQLVGALSNKFPAHGEARLGLGSSDLNQSNQESSHSQEDSIDEAHQHSKPPSPKSSLNGREPWKLPVDLPSKRTAESIIRLYFEGCNSMFPILHREQFIQRYFEPVYGCVSPGIQLCSKFTNLNLKHSSNEPGTGTFYRRWVDCSNSMTAAPEPAIQCCLFFLFMVFGLGSVIDYTNAPFQDENMVMGTRYFSAALNYFPAVTRGYVNGRELASLQAILLISLYGIVRPSTANAWYTIGDAMRMCIDMGLHNEKKANEKRLNSSESGISTLKNDDPNNALFAKEKTDDFTIDLRRRLFWVTYLMERSTCISLCRPTCLQDEMIQCELPSLVDDSWQIPIEKPRLFSELESSEHGSDPNSPVNSSERLKDESNGRKPLFDPPNRPSYKWVFSGMLHLRKIQYKIRELLYERVDLSDVDQMRKVRDGLALELEEWHRMTPWDQSTFNFDWNTDLFEVAYLYSRVLLYRNSNAIPHPTIEESKLLLDSGVRLLKLWIKIGDTEYRQSPWPIFHDNLQTATACMYALHVTNAFNQTYDLKSFENTIEGILKLLKKFKATTETASTHYDSLKNMMRKTMDYLQSPENRKRKRSSATTGIETKNDHSVAPTVAPIPSQIPIQTHSGLPLPQQVQSHVAVDAVPSVLPQQSYYYPYQSNSQFAGGSQQHLRDPNSAYSQLGANNQQRSSSSVAGVSMSPSNRQVDITTQVAPGSAPIGGLNTSAQSMASQNAEPLQVNLQGQIQHIYPAAHQPIRSPISADTSTVPLQPPPPPPSHSVPVSYIVNQIGQTTVPQAPAAHSSVGQPPVSSTAQPLVMQPPVTQSPLTQSRFPPHYTQVYSQGHAPSQPQGQQHVSPGFYTPVSARPEHVNTSQYPHAEYRPTSVNNQVVNVQQSQQYGTNQSPSIQPVNSFENVPVSSAPIFGNHEKTLPPINSVINTAGETFNIAPPGGNAKTDGHIRDMFNSTQGGFRTGF